MGRERKEIESQAITGEDWEASGCEALRQLMYQAMGLSLGAGTKCKGRDQLCSSIIGDPEPSHFGRALELKP